MITCNGSPKTGTHLLLKAVYLFGGDCTFARHNHVPAPSKVDGKHCHIIRNPRNVVLSWIRFNKLPVFSVSYMENMKQCIGEMKEYVEWINNPEVFNTTFEKLLTDETELDRMSEYLEQPKIENHYQKLWGGTPTFTGKLSNWRDIWTPETNNMWIKLGGTMLEFSLGYDINKQWIREVV